MSAEPSAGSSAGGRGRLLKAALVLLATFALGALAGVGFSRWSRPAFPPPPPGGPVPVRELDLSPSQHEQIHSILERHRPEVEAILDESRPRIEEVNRRVEAEAREVLTEAQSRRWDQIKARPRSQRGSQHRGPPRGPRR